MKLIIILSFLFIARFGYSQSKQIPNIKFEKEMDSVNAYISLLNLKDPNSLIIETSLITESNRNHTADIIVFQNDGQVLKFNSFGRTENKKVKQRKVKDENVSKYWNWLSNLIQYDNYRFYNAEFNGTGPTIIIFQMFQGRNTISATGRYPKKFDFIILKTLGQQEQRLFLLAEDETKLFSEQ